MKNNKKVIDKKDDKNILMKLFILIITNINNRSLATSYKFIGYKIIYDKV